MIDPDAEGADLAKFFGIPQALVDEQVAFAERLKKSEDRVKELEDEVLELRKDAERLDWLEKQEGTYRGIDADVADLPFWEVCGVQGQSVREAIDAAIEAERGEG